MNLTLWLKILLILTGKQTRIKVKATRKNPIRMLSQQWPQTPVKKDSKLGFPCWAAPQWKIQIIMRCTALTKKSAKTPTWVVESTQPLKLRVTGWTKRIDIWKMKSRFAFSKVSSAKIHTGQSRRWRSCLYFWTWKNLKSTNGTGIEGRCRTGTYKNELKTGTCLSNYSKSLKSTRMTCQRKLISMS